MRRMSWPKANREAIARRRNRNRTRRRWSFPRRRSGPPISAASLAKAAVRKRARDSHSGSRRLGNRRLGRYSPVAAASRFAAEITTSVWGPSFPWPVGKARRYWLRHRRRERRAFRREEPLFLHPSRSWKRIILSQRRPRRIEGFMDGDKRFGVVDVELGLQGHSDAPHGMDAGRSAT